MKNLKIILLTAVVLTFSTSLIYGEILYQHGLLRVENTEHYQYIYDGYLQTNLRELVDGYRADRGYIRYSGGKEGDTGRLWTDYSRGETVSVSHRYTDTLNPIAPKTKFNYDFEWTPGSPHDVFRVKPTLKAQ